MDQEIMEGIVLSYTKILKEIKEIREKIDSMMQQNKSRVCASAPEATHNVPGEEKLSRRGRGRGTRGRKSARGNKNTEAETPASSAAGESRAVASDFFKKLEDSI